MRTFVIAEAGVNHNGSLDLAFGLVDAAAGAGADCVKFQTFRADALATVAAPKAAYQEQTTGVGESQLEMLRRLELSPEAHRALTKRCAERGVVFLSTPFDLQSLAFLVELGVGRLKLGSGEITNGPLLLAAARSGLPLVVSTGMCTLDEVREAVTLVVHGWLRPDAAPTAASLDELRRTEAARAVVAERLVLLQCTSEYPAPYEDVNLRAMDTLRETFGVPVGLSDHTPGIAIPIAAVARGATVIEKHVTLDRTLPGPDHRASIEPDELAAMVRGIRQAEVALGHGTKAPAPSEVRNRAVARKGIVAAAAIRAGAMFTADNLTTKRPLAGLSPMRWWDVLGRRARRDYAPDEPIDPAEIDG